MRVAMVLLLASALVCLSAAVLRADEPAGLPALVLQTGHSNAVTTVAFQPGGTLLATGSYDDSVRLWDSATGRVLGSLPVATAVLALAFSPDGRTLVTSDGTLWDVATAQPRGSLQVRASYTYWASASSPNQVGIYSVDFSPDGATVATASVDGAVRLWDARSGLLQSTFHTGEWRIWNLSFSPDGRRLAVCTGPPMRYWKIPEYGMAGILDLGTGRLSLAVVQHQAVRARFSPDGKRLAVCCGEGKAAAVRILDASDGREAIRLPHPDTVWDARFSPDGRYLLTGCGDGRGRLWDAASGRLLAMLEGHTGCIAATAFSRDTTLAATASEDHTARLFEVPSGRQRTVLAGRTRPIRWMEFARDGRSLLVESETASQYDEKRPAGLSSTLWDMVGGRVQESWPHSCGFRADGSIYGLEADRVWDAASGRSLLPEASAAPGSRILATNGELALRVRGEQAVELVALDGKSPPVALKETPKALRAAALSRDGRWLATVGSGDEIRIWTTSPRALRWTLRCDRTAEVIPFMAFSPDGRWFAAGSWTWNHLDVWSLESDRPAARFPVAGVSGGLAFSPDSARLGAAYGTQVSLWDLAGKSIHAILHHNGFVRAFAFSPDGRVAATGGDDGTLRFWNAENGAFLASAFAIDGGREWAAVSPEGFIDASPGAFPLMEWRLGAEMVPVEAYFNDFFQPGLLGDVMHYARPLPFVLLQRHDPRASLQLAARDRRLPRVTLTAPASSDRRTVGLTIHLDVSAQGDSGIQDLRIFRNGVLAQKWSGPQTPGDRTATLPIVAGPNHFVAYAFNRDNVKSRDAEATVVGALSLARQPQAWVFTIGINRYAQQKLDLHYAAADAEDMAATLQSKLPFPPAAIHVEKLLDEKATRAGVLDELRSLGERVQPEDSVIISYSGHGLLANGRFYVVPHDVASLASIEEVAAHSISDADLETALLPIQARHLLLILDACHSGEALESAEWRRGPLNARGLVQLAWEKGMELLTASQSQQVAVEALKIGNQDIGHGLLTYALIEGFDAAPRHRGRLMASGWLDYAARRVPRLMASGSLRGRDLQEVPAASQPAQIPCVFHARDSLDWPVAGAEGDKP